jgi:hypothetical protein
MIARMRRKDLRARLSVAIASRLSPEHTRRATLFERLTVERLSWDQVVRLNRYLALLGKLTTTAWVAFVGSAILGVDWQSAAEKALNSGRPIKEALVLAILVPTLAFLAIRSVVGFARWRLQRELWRRDVERLSSG